MKKKKSKKRKFLKKLNEDQETNLVMLGILALGGLLYYFALLGTVVNGALGLWVLWSLLAVACVGLIYWKEVIGATLLIIGIAIVLTLAVSIYDNFTYTRCVDKFKERPYTYDIKKFIDCGMINYSDAEGKSQEQVLKKMITKYSRK